MKYILFEVCYRIVYIVGTITIIECFSYFVLGYQLEYLSGLLALNYQAVDFNFVEDFKQIKYLLSFNTNLKEENDCLPLKDIQKQSGLCKEKSIILEPPLFSYFESYSLDEKPVHLLTLSANEGKAWFYLFLSCLSYFYCLEVDKSGLSNVLAYLKLMDLSILVLVHIYTVCIPGLLKKWVENYFFICMVIIIILLVSKPSILLLAASFEELQLEQLDSELL